MKRTVPSLEREYRKDLFKSFDYGDAYSEAYKRLDTTWESNWKNSTDFMQVERKRIDRQFRWKIAGKSLENRLKIAGKLIALPH